MRWNAGKKSIAKTYAISRAVPESVCSFAALVTLGPLLHSHISLLEQSRFGLDSQVEWCEQDQEFVYEAFYRNLMQLFKDEEWAAETIEWYNVCVHPFSSTLLMLIAFSEVFGPGHHDDSGRLLAGPSSLSMIANSRVRRARGTTDAPTAPSTSSTGPSASTSGDTSSASPAAGDTSSASGAAGDHAPTSGSTPVSTDGSPLVDTPVPPATVPPVVTRPSGAVSDASAPAPAAPVSAATEPAVPATPVSAAVVTASAPPANASTSPDDSAQSRAGSSPASSDDTA